VFELADNSVVAIADPDATADPSSGAAVLYGVARFTVAPRGEGEGPFLVYTPSGIIGTKGTVYGVGVSANADVRVGVESGSVEIAPAAKLDQPMEVKAGSAATVTVAGELSAGAFKEDDWGEWRDAGEAELEAASVAELHVGRLEALEAEADTTYAELETLAGATAEANLAAEQAEKAGDTAAYEANGEDRAATIEATFGASVKLQHLTYAMLAHGYLAGELYVRHPEKVETIYVAAKPRVHGTVLYHKKYHAVTHVHVRPLRAAYYRHHPRGRKHAKLVGNPTAKFYLDAKIAPINVEVVAKRAKFRPYRAPVVRDHRKGKKVWVTPPRVGWHTKVKVKPAKVRAGATWYVGAKAPRAKLVVGIKPKRQHTVVFGGAKAGPRGKAVVKFGGGVHVRDHRGGADVVVGPKGGVKVRDHRGGADVVVGPKGAAKIRDHRGGVDIKSDGKGGIKIRDHRGGGVKVDGKGGVNIRDHRGGAGIKVDGKGGVKIRDHRGGGGVKVDGKGGVKIRDHRGGGGVKVDGKGGVKIRDKRKKGK
jgi:hypothetical protein